MKSAALSLLLLVAGLMPLCCLSAGSSKAHRAQAPSRAAYIYETDTSGFPAVQPPACIPPDSCQPISAAPPCCSRGRGVSSLSGTGLSTSRGNVGGKTAHKSSAAATRRQRYSRYSGAAHAEARDQELPGGCLMRETLIEWDIVATLICPGQNVQSGCSHAECNSQVAFHQTLIGTVSSADQQSPASARRRHSSAPAKHARDLAAMPAPQRPPDIHAAGGHAATRGSRKRQTLGDHMLPPQHVLEMAWRQITEAAETCVPADDVGDLEQQLVMQHCDDTSCWQEVAGEAHGTSDSDTCTAAADCDTAAGDQCGQAVADDSSFCMVGGEEAVDGVVELEGLSMFGLAFLLLGGAALFSVCICYKSIRRRQQHIKRLLKGPATRALIYLLDLQPCVQSTTAPLGAFIGVAACWLASAGVAGYSRCRWALARSQQLVARPAAWHAQRAATRATAAKASSRQQQNAIPAPQQPAGRQTPSSSKRRQRPSSPASAAAAAAKPSRRARRRLQSPAAQDSTAAATVAAATAAATTAAEVPVQQAGTVPEADGMEHKAPLDQLQPAVAELSAAAADDVIKQSSKDESTPAAANLLLIGMRADQDIVPAADATTHIALVEQAAEVHAAAHPAPAAAVDSVGSATPAAEADVLDVADASCVMCLDLPKDVILAPCGHQCLCRDCTLLLMSSVKPTGRCCPVCRTKIDSYVAQVYKT